MVDFLYNSTPEEVEDDKKNQPFSDPLSQLSIPDFDEFSLSFADSLLDFDSLSDLMSDSPMADKKQQPLELGSVNDGVSEKCQTQTEDPLSCLNQEESQIGVSEKCDIQMEDPLSCLNQEECQIGVSEKGDIQTEDPLSCLNHEQSSENGMKVEEFDSIVEEKMGRVSISGIEDERVVDQADVGNVSGSVVAAAAAMISKNEESDNKVVISSKVVERIVNDNGNGSIVSNSDTESESESEREASSSASSSDSDEDESSSNDEAEEEANMEEGEIVASDVDEMVGWDDDDEDTGVKGPIRSKNEVQVIIIITLYVNGSAFELLMIVMFELLMKVKYQTSTVIVPLKLIIPQLLLNQILVNYTRHLLEAVLLRVLNVHLFSIMELVECSEINHMYKVTKFRCT